MAQLVRFCGENTARLVPSIPEKMLPRCPGSAEIPAPVADGSCSGGISFEPTNHPEEFV